MLSKTTNRVKRHKGNIKLKASKPTIEVVIIVIILLIGCYFLISSGGITGALVGITDVPVDPEVRQQIAANGEAEVIVVLRDNFAASNLVEQQREIADVQEKVLMDLVLENRSGIFSLKEQEFALKYKYANINALAGSITKEGLDKLQQDYHVAEIKVDRKINLFLNQSIPLINGNNLPSANFSFTGTGQSVCIVDTGIDYTHSAFGSCSKGEFLTGRCRVSGYNIAEDNADPLDQHGHGTHVAGIVASNYTNYLGVAPGAGVVAVKVFPGSSSATNESNVIAGIDWCVSNAANFSISVISLSIGDGTINSNYCDSSSLAIAVNSAVDAGLLVVAASGNSYNANGISSPACASKAVSVGATTKIDTIPSYSNSAAILDVLAPGSSITSTSLNNNIATLSGTSMSAPHAAGAAIIINQYFKEVHQQNLTPADLEARLKRGISLQDSRNGLVFPRIDLIQAIKPVISVISPPAGTSNANTTLLIVATADVPVNNMFLEWDGFNYSMNLSYWGILNTTAFAYNLSNLSLGAHYYRIYATDPAGLVGESLNQSIIVSLPVPSVEFNFLSSYLNEGIFVINITATASEGISTVNFTVNNASFSLILPAVNTGDGYWAALLNLSLLSEGPWNISVTATDNLGAVNSTEYRPIVVDRTIPLISNYSITTSTLYSNSQITFSANVTDSNLESVTVSSSHTGQLLNYTMLLVNNSYLYLVSPPLVLGNHTYTIYARDLSSNMAVSSADNFVVKNSVPSNLLIYTPVNDSSFIKNSQITFSANATDIDNQVLTYTWDFADGQTAVGAAVLYSYPIIGNYTVVLRVSDGMDTASTTLAIEINELVSNSSNSSSLDSSTSSSSSGGGSGGSSSGSSSIEINSVPELEEVIAEEDSETIVDSTNEQQPLEAVSIEPAAEDTNPRFGLNLVGAAVGDFILDNQGWSLGTVLGMALIFSLAGVYLFLRKKHQAELYGIEAAVAVRSENIKK